MKSKKKKQGLASIPASQRKQIASLGGSSHSSAHMAEIGRRGGKSVSADRNHMSQIGTRGGESVSKDAGHMASIGQRGGLSVSSNKKRMAEIGRRGGLSKGRS